MIVKQNRLTKRKEFGYIYKHGKNSYSKYLKLVYVPTKLNQVRVGFSISKKVGKAHTRNLIKRRLNAILFDLIKEDRLKTNNYIFVVNLGIDNLEFNELKDQVLTLLNKENLINE